MDSFLCEIEASKNVVATLKKGLVKIVAFALLYSHCLLFFCFNFTSPITEAAFKLVDLIVTTFF